MFTKEFIFKLLNITKYSISFSALFVAHHSFTEFNAVTKAPNILVPKIVDESLELSSKVCKEKGKLVVLAAMLPESSSEKTIIQPKVTHRPGWPH